MLMSGVLSQILFQEGEDLIGLFAGLIGGLIGLVFAAVFIVAMWKIFTKAGQPGWASLIPIYNIYVLLEVVGRPTWWLVLFLIPGVNAIAAAILMLDLAASFGKGMGFGIGLILLPFIFMLILAFGDARYQGPIQAF
jgi:hypothetical protein